MLYGELITVMRSVGLHYRDACKFMSHLCKLCTAQFYSTINSKFESEVRHKFFFGEVNNSVDVSTCSNMNSRSIYK